MKEVAFSLLMLIANSGKHGLQWKNFVGKIKVSSATLAKHLALLQKEGLIEKKAISVSPITVKYFITDKGMDAFVKEGEELVKRMKRTQEMISRAVVR